MSRIRVLDGWRAISVALVIAAHLFGYSSVAFEGACHFSEILIKPLIEELGRMGVFVFFVISGFVICRGLLLEKKANGRVSISAFYIRRIFRIIPPLIFYVAVVALAGQLFGINVPPVFFRTLTFVCNLRIDCGGWFGGHTWSLSVEEQFYLLMPLTFLLAARPRRTILLCAVVGLAIMAPTLYYLGVGLGSPKLTTGGKILEEFLPISAGVVCALFESPIRRIAAKTPLWLFLLAALFSLVLLRLTNSPFEPLAVLGLSPVIAFLLMASLDGPDLVQRCLSASWMQPLGRASYGIYLWQQVATAPFRGAHWSFYIFSIVGCVAWSLFSFRLFETPLIGLGRKLSQKTH